MFIVFLNFYFIIIVGKSQNKRSKIQQKITNELTYKILNLSKPILWSYGCVRYHYSFLLVCQSMKSPLPFNHLAHFHWQIDYTSLLTNMEAW